MKHLIPVAAIAALSLGACDSGRIAELESQVEALSARVTEQEDIEQVRQVAFSYGYYMDNALYSQVLAMFSDDIESCEVAGYGQYIGIEGCTRMWRELMGSYYGGDTDQMAFGRIAKHYLLKDVITIDPDGEHAHGRFDYMSMGQTYGQPDRTGSQLGVYNFSFVKEDGIWKISKFWLAFDTINFNHRDSAINPAIRCPSDRSEPDAPASQHHPFPEFAIAPFHYPNPVTGEDIPGYVNPTRYWEGNWPGEFGGPCGKRADAPEPVSTAPRAPTGR